MSGQPRVSVDDIRGVYAIMPTPALEDAQDASLDDTLDLDEVQRAVNLLIGDGVNAVMGAGTFGEGAALTWDEMLRFSEVVITTASGRVPIFLGATTLNTRDTISRAKALLGLGADGLLLGRPMWSPCDDVDLVRFYRDVATAVPELAIIVYDNPEAFKGKIAPDTYAALADIPQVVAAKYPGIAAGFFDDLTAVGGRIRMLPVDRDWFEAWSGSPEEVVACWSGSASCGPQALVEMSRRMLGGDSDGAKEISDQMQAASQGFFPEGSPALFARYNVQLEKIRINEAGYIKAGPSRPPYTHCPDEYAEGAKTSGRRLAELNVSYRGVSA